MLHTFVLPYCTHHVHMQHMCCRRNAAIKHVCCIQKNWNSASHVPHMCIWGMHVCTKKHATCVHSLVCYTCVVACMPLMSCAPFYLHAACLWRISIFVYVAHKYVFVCYSYAATCMPLISSDILLLACCMPMARFNFCVCGTQALWYISACLPGRRGTCAASLPGRCLVDVVHVVHVLHLCLVDVW